MKNKENTGRLMWFDFSDSENILIHSHAEPELFYVLEGEADVTADEDKIHLEKDDFIVINANRPHSVKGKNDFLSGFIHMDYKKICEYMGNGQVFFICDSTKENQESYEEIRKIVRRIFGKYFERDGLALIRLDIFFHQLLAELIGNFQIFQEHPKYKSLYGSEDERRKNYVAEYMENRYMEKVSLADIAGALYLSETYFSKYIKQKFGMTFVEYLNEIRIRHAVEDLLYTEHSLTRIAMDNGFSNAAVLNRVFKNKYGTLPSEFKKRKKQARQSMETPHPGQEADKRLMERVREYIQRENTDPEETGENAARIYANTEEQAGFSLCGLIVNIGTVESLLNSMVQQQILALKARLNFEYIRFWGLYSRELYLIVDMEKQKFNFNRIDRGLDFLIENKIHPFIEIGMKPLQIIRTLDDYVLYKEPEITFKTPEEYGIFVKAFVTHCVNRYGESEVAVWYFEVWCELKAANILKYWDYFESAYRAVKACLPKARIGGGGFNMSRDQEKLRRFLRKGKTENTGMDFVSLNSYHYIPYAQHGKEGTMDKKWRRSVDSKYLYNQIRIAREIMEEEEAEDLELCAECAGCEGSLHNPVRYEGRSGDSFRYVL